jgi:hypothetical protein
MTEATDGVSAVRLVRTRVEAAIEDLRQAKSALEALGLDAADRTLTEHVEIDFESEIAYALKRMSDLGAAVSVGTPPLACWRKLEHAQAATDTLLAECHAYIEGVLARRSGAGSATLELADQLLSDVARKTSVHWGGFTVYAESDYLGEVGRIIRLRFPAEGIWGMPVALHELGHHAMPQLGRRRLDGASERPFAEMLASARAARGNPLAALQRSNHLAEIMADAFATYAGGPGLALAGAFLRFTPTANEDFHHPSAGVRMHAIVRGLALSCPTPAKPTVDAIRALWRTSLGAQAAPPTDPELDRAVDEIYSLLDLHAHSARYTGWTRALGLADELAEARREQLSLPLRVERNIRRWDIVNACWMHRLEFEAIDPYNLRNLSAWAVARCAETVDS